jgi:outer membrane protein assembly factor BamB
MRMPLAVSNGVVLCGRSLSAATVLAALALVLGEIPAADQPAKTGNRGAATRWRVATSAVRGDYVLALAVGKDGLIYSGSWGGTDVDVFGPDGVLRRKLSVGIGAKALAVGKDGTVFAGTDGYAIVVFGPDGTRRGRFVVRESSGRGGQIEALWAGDNGVVYAAAGNDVYAIDPDGETRWRSTTLAPVDPLTMGSDGILYAGAGDAVYAFGPEGTLKSKFGVGSRPGVIAAIGLVALAFGRGDTLYAGTIDRMVYALDARDGAIKWTFKPRGTPFALAEGHDGAIYVGSYDGNIYALDPGVGRVRWRFSTGNGRWGDNPVHALAVGNDGVLYAGVGSSVEAITLVSSQK